jgi:hypothetical protein
MNPLKHKMAVLKQIYKLIPNRIIAQNMSNTLIVHSKISALFFGSMAGGKTIL